MDDNEYEDVDDDDDDEQEESDVTDAQMSRRIVRRRMMIVIISMIYLYMRSTASMLACGKIYLKSSDRRWVNDIMYDLSRHIG